MQRQKGKSLVAFAPDYVVVDIETTGISSDQCEIIEIGAIKVVNHEIVETFNVLLKASASLPPFIVQLTGIDDALLAQEGMDANEAFVQFLLFVGDAIIVGHNVNFDINFLYDHILDRLGVVLCNDYIDTLRLSRKYLNGVVRNHRLGTLTSHFGFSYEGAHRGLADCHFTYQVYNALMEISLGYR